MVYVENLSLKKKKKKKSPINHRVISENPNPIKKNNPTNTKPISSEKKYKKKNYGGLKLSKADQRSRQTLSAHTSTRTRSCTHMHKYTHMHIYRILYIVFTAFHILLHLDFGIHICA